MTTRESRRCSSDSVSSRRTRLSRAPPVVLVPNDRLDTLPPKECSCRYRNRAARWMSVKVSTCCSLHQSNITRLDSDHLNWCSNHGPPLDPRSVPRASEAAPHYVHSRYVSGCVARSFRCRPWMRCTQCSVSNRRCRTFGIPFRGSRLLTTVECGGLGRASAWHRRALIPTHVVRGTGQLKPGRFVATDRSAALATTRVRRAT